MEQENRLTYVDEDGNEVLCEILFTFESEEFGKNYVVFYPVGSETEEGVEVMAASYTPEGDGVGELAEIETDEEWDLVEEVLQQYDEECCGDDCDCEDECDDDCDCGCCHHHE